MVHSFENKRFSTVSITRCLHCMQSVRVRCRSVRLSVCHIHVLYIHASRGQSWFSVLKKAKCSQARLRKWSSVGDGDDAASVADAAAADCRSSIVLVDVRHQRGTSSGADRVRRPVPEAEPEGSHA